MSHATVLVISKKNDRVTIEKLMEPYWELDLKLEDLMKDLRSKFEPYMTIEEAKEKHEKIAKKYPEEKYNEMALETFMCEWNGYILKGGKFGYFHNPNAKWDWYRIGGRFAGRIKLKNNGKGYKGEKGYEYDFMKESKDPYENNKVDSAQIKEIDPKFLKNLTSYAVLNEKGWHEKSRLGWFGCSIYEKYCCIAEELTIKEICQHFKHDYFGINNTWKGISNKYIIKFIEILHNYYKKEDKIYKLKNNLGNGKTEITEDLKHYDFFRNKHWSKNFYNRFIKDLDPSMYLTFVDYHI